MSAPYVAGSPYEKIALIGEAPGAEEARAGGAFVGKAGQLLTELLQHAGISRSQCYFDNLFQFRPDRNDITPFLRLGRIQETPVYHEQREQLRQRLDQSKANVLVPLGNAALYALTGKTNVSKLRGSILESTLLPGRKVIPTIHPSAALREFLFRYYIVNDLLRVRQNAETPHIQLLDRTLHLNPSQTDVEDFLALCHTTPRVAYDIEVKGMELSHLALAINPSLAMCIPFVHGLDDYWSPPQEAHIMQLITRLMADKNVEKIGQNLSFDATFLYSKYNIVAEPLQDTMIAAGILYPDFPKGLDFLVAQYCEGEPYYKDDGKEWFKNPFGSEEIFRRYNAMDAAVLMEIFPAQEDELKRQGNYESYLRQKSLLHPLVYAGNKGIRMDVDRMKSASIECAQHIDALQAELNETAQRPLNANSPKQLKEYFYIEKRYRAYTKNGSITVDDKALKRLASQGAKEADIILNLRKERKMQGTYYEMKLDPDNRMRCSFNPIGTAQGRISSSKTIRGTGCLSGDTEVLTPDGWVTLESFDPEKQTAMIYDHTKDVLLFSSVNKIITPVVSHCVKFSGTAHKTTYTVDHRLPLLSSRGKPQIKFVSELQGLSEVRLKIGSRYKGGSFKTSTLNPRLYAAYIADGSNAHNKIKFALAKTRKIERLKSLWPSAQAGKTQYRPDSLPLQTFYISGLEAEACQLLGKTLGPWLLQMPAAWLEAFLDECQHWDATVRNRSFWFFTTIPENAEWVATLAHLCGKGATVNINKDNNNGFGQGSNKWLYTVNVKPRDYTFLDAEKHTELIPWNKETYCLSTPTGGFLIRSEGIISCTLNSNLQNQPWQMNALMLADPGHILINQDLGQAENRVVAFVSGESKMMKAFEEGIDIHTQTASMIYEVPPDEVTKDQRDWGKRANHGLNYDLGYRSFALYYQITDREAKDIVERYHEIYKGVREWHATVREDLSRANKTLVNCFGRKRTFLDRWGHDLFKVAYSYIPQSTIAELMNTYGVCFLYYRQDIFPEVQFLNTIHDSIRYQIPISVGPQRIVEIIKAMKGSLEAELSWRGKTFSIPVDTELGFSFDKKTMLEWKANKIDSSSDESLTQELGQWIENWTIG